MFVNHLSINVHSCDVDNYDEAAGCGVVFCRTRIGYLKRVLNCQLLVKYTNKQYSEYIEWTWLQVFALSNSQDRNTSTRTDHKQRSASDDFVTDVWTCQQHYER